MKGARRNCPSQIRYRRLVVVAGTVLVISYFIFLGSHHSRGAIRPNAPDIRHGSTPAHQDVSSGINGTNPDEELTVVIASKASEDTSWVKLKFPRMNSAIYIVDDDNANRQFRTPMNKGNEAMVYLTYIIDHYEHLPAVSVFAHAHIKSEHTDDVLGGSMVESLQRLRPSQVQKDGYFNMRCNWKPGGCPLYLNLHDPARSKFGGMEQASILKAAWSELFPSSTASPEWASQPYGGQFAASREAIRNVPLKDWVRWRDWLVMTELTDYHSGRVWEYTWQYVLAGMSTFCPPPRDCYCEGYGVCFGSNFTFEEWTSRQDKLDDAISEYLLRNLTREEATTMQEWLDGEKTVLEKALKRAKEQGSALVVG